MADANHNREYRHERLRLNITASELHDLRSRDTPAPTYRNRRLERLVAARHNPRYWCHYAFIYPYPSLRPTW